jgi:hypothetical protein
MQEDFIRETLRFKDLMTVNYLPGEPEEVQYRNHRQKRTSMGGGPSEALTRQARLQRARIMRRNKAKIQRGIKIARNRMASPEKLKNRARKAARKVIFNKISRDIPKDELTFERRAEIEKRLNTPAMKRRIDMLSTKLLKDVRRKELERRRPKND